GSAAYSAATRRDSGKHEELGANYTARGRDRNSRTDDARLSAATSAGSATIQRTRRGQRRRSPRTAASHRRSRLSTRSVSPETPRSRSPAGAGGPRRERRGSQN